MECNRGEAVRAKEIAEKKFNAKDIRGAKKFALKAQALFPGLEGIAQMLATLNVYMNAENRKNGEADWYGILDVTHSSDDETVRRQYRKLALILHPDKNKSVGAEGAFKFVSAAWSVLSDKSKRAAYDQRVSGKVFEQKTATPNQGQASRGANGFYDFVGTAFSGSRVNKNSSRENTSHSHAPHAPLKAKANTFWTICQKCKMQYEYLRIYVNQNLLCPNCRQPFVAVETPPPPPPTVDPKISGNSSRQHHSKSRTAKTSSNANGAADFQWAPFSRGGTSSVAHAASVVQQTYEKVKREREEALAAKRREKPSKRKYYSSEYTEHMNFAKKKRASEEGGSSRMNQCSSGNGGVSVANTAHKHRNSETVQRNETNKMSMLSQAEIHDILKKKARAVICKRMQFKSDSAPNKVVPKEHSAGKIHDEKGSKNPDPCYQKEAQVSADRKMVDTNNFSPSASIIEHGRKTLESLSQSVQDPDFYYFDKNRTERAFEENQVWAAYDDNDGMPRYYAIIQSVLSRDPFKVRISWLNSKTNTELGSLNWLGSGFSKTCGDFRAGRYEINSSLDSFSHKVVFTRGASQGIIRVFPRKGDVWALYRNWSPDWNELTSAEIIHKYDLVEVLEDYDEELGVIVIPLVKVAGFKTVFGQHLDRNQVRRIPREEMFRFSHQVPHHLLTRKDAPESLKDCVELDPAATPPDLLYLVAVETEVVEEENEDPADSEKENDLKQTDAEKHEEDNSLKQAVAEKHEVAGNPNKEKVVEIMVIE